MVRLVTRAWVMILDQVYRKLQQFDPTPHQNLAYLKKWLRKCFKRDITKHCISQHRKREDMLCFTGNTSNILQQHHANVQFGDEKTQIIKTALKFICNDIATIDLDTKSYPSAHSMTDIPSQLALVPRAFRCS